MTKLIIEHKFMDSSWGYGRSERTVFSLCGNSKQSCGKHSLS